MRKKVDERIRTLIENGVKDRHRSIFVVIGDKSLDTIVNLHYMLSKAVIKARPSVLWCYKEKLELSSHKKKRAKQVKKMMQRGLLDPEKADPYSLFLESGAVSHCLYRDSERILGSTYAMCVLQDFEASTPNILARTIETVEGGGLVVILLQTLSSLTSLYTMVIDVHERFRTESHSEIVPRFNERFMLSLATCKSCLVMDDEFNILPISLHAKSTITTSSPEGCGSTLKSQEDLKNLREEYKDVLPIEPLLQICSTLDQGRCVENFLEKISNKSLQSTVALTGARGRGKSAALGLAIAGAVAFGYSRIFVTAPSPENLKSLFDFVCKGLRALNYEEHLHYDIGRSSKPELRRAITQININKEHKQIVQYIEPQDHVKLFQAELLVIDEAAAIPLPVVKKLLGSYLVFISSTVNGYEGSGQSLTLKLFQHLKKQTQVSVGGGRSFREIDLEEPIGYAPQDPVETWLNSLLCLDATNSKHPISRLPHPENCSLYYVNRDLLFSSHKTSEIFLQRMMTLFVSSHHKYSPNDLQGMADAPAHHLFVLLGPLDENSNVFPDIFCAIQVCLEGEISRTSALQNLQMGRLPSGEQIPGKFFEKFGNSEFPSLSGVRIVRIAVHPDATGQGYGSAALEHLTRYYEGKSTSIDEANVVEDNNVKLHHNIIEAAKEVSLREETITPRKNLPSMLTCTDYRRPEKVHYIGVSFGLNLDLFQFWKKHGYTPFYLCHIPNNTTGEHSCMVLKPLDTDDTKDALGPLSGLTPFYQRFKREFLKNLPLYFKDLDYELAMRVLDPKINFSETETSLAGDMETSNLVKSILSPHEFELLERYASNHKGYDEVRHLQPHVAYWYFEGKFPVTLSHLEASLLLCTGIQLHDLTYIEKQMKIERQQILTLLHEVMVKFYNYFYGVWTKDFDVTLPHHKELLILNQPFWYKEQFNPEPCGNFAASCCVVSIDEDLDDGAREVREKIRLQAEKPEKCGHLAVLDLTTLQQYAVGDRETEIEQALKRCSKISSTGILSVKKSSKTNFKKQKSSDGTRKDKRRKR